MVGLVRGAWESMSCCTAQRQSQSSRAPGWLIKGGQALVHPHGPHDAQALRTNLDVSTLSIIVPPAYALTDPHPQRSTFITTP